MYVIFFATNLYNLALRIQSHISLVDALSRAEDFLFVFCFVHRLSWFSKRMYNVIARDRAGVEFTIPCILMIR